MAKDPYEGIYTLLWVISYKVLFWLVIGTVKGTPQALAELRQVYEYMDREAISSTDPEPIYLGYMDLLRSIYLF